MTLEQAGTKMLIKEPFWGLFMIGINKRFSDKIPTLGVAKGGIGVDLVVNEEFWNSLNDNEQIAVLVHELHHISLGHIFTHQNYTDKRRFNIAADLEVNCYIQNLPKNALHPRQFNFKENEGTKEYYKLLEGQLSSIQAIPSGSNLGDQKNEEDDFSTLDDHSSWEDFKDLSESEQSLIRDSISSQLVRAYEQCKSAGSIPGSVKELIEGFLEKKPRIPNWKNLLKTNIASHIDTKFKKTYKMVSKRFEGAPGIRLSRKSKILVAIDTSGSVSDNELKEFFNEIHHISKMGVYIDILEFDYEIYPVCPFVPNRSVSIYGRGGTSFRKPIEYFNKHHKGYSMLIMFTDGECYIPDIQMHTNKMLWVITSNGFKQNYPGKTIYIPTTQK